MTCDLIMMKSIIIIIINMMIIRTLIKDITIGNVSIKTKTILLKVLIIENYKFTTVNKKITLYFY